MKYIYTLGILLFTTVAVFGQTYNNVSKTLVLGDFLDTSTDTRQIGSLTVNNDILTVDLDLTNSYNVLKTGRAIYTSISPRVPDMNLGYLTPNQQFYLAIKDNYLYVLGEGGSSDIDLHVSIDLNNPPSYNPPVTTVDNYALNGTEITADGSTPPAGYFYITYRNQTLTFDISVSLGGEKSLKTGNILYLSTSDVLPNMDIGYVGDVDNPNAYLLRIVDNHLNITGSGLVNILNTVTYSFDLSSDCDTRRINYSPSWVRETNVLSPITNPSQITSLSVDQRTITTSYLDGLGRPIQSVARQAASDQKDLVTRIDYDAFGRENRQYLSYASVQTNGSFKTTAIEDQCAYYRGVSTTVEDEVAYSETVYENSALNRPLKQYGPGQDWRQKDRKVSYAYQMNTSADAVHKFTASMDAVRPTHSGNHRWDELTVTRTTDEEGRTVEEYVDEWGQTLLKKVEAGISGTQTQWAETYYVYDKVGNLKFVLPPQAIENIYDFLGASNTDKDSFLDQWAFQYQYDGRNRMVAKRVPGSGWTYMIYDQMDRLVLTQDAVQRSKSLPEWTFTKYDHLSRPILTGIYRSTLPQSDLQKNVNGYTTPVHRIDWKENNTVNYQSGVFTKPGAIGWNAGTASEEYLAAGQSGQVSVELTETNFYRMFGFSASDNSLHHSDIDFAIYLRGGSIIVYESGANRGQKTTAVTGDILTVERKGSQVFYKKNGSVIYTSTRSLNSALQVDMSFYHQWTTLKFVSPAYEQWGGDHHGYTNNSFPIVEDTNDYLTVTYYDHYDYLTQSDYHSVFYYTSDGMGSVATDQGTAIFPVAINTVKGQVAGTKTKILGTNQWLRQVFYYDDRYRTIQTINENHKGGTDRVSTLYNFPGWVMKTKQTHSKAGAPTLSIVRRYKYDHAGRVLKGYHQMTKNGVANPEVLLAENLYNPLGELIEKNLHVESGTPLQSVDYRYNIRGWLQSINAGDLEENSLINPNDLVEDYFGMELIYNKAIDLNK